MIGVDLIGQIRRVSLLVFLLVLPVHEDENDFIFNRL
jgi:hypothetical protein